MSNLRLGVDTLRSNATGKLACSAARSAGNIPLITSTKVHYGNVVCGATVFYADDAGALSRRKQIDSHSFDPSCTRGNLAKKKVISFIVIMMFVNHKHRLILIVRVESPRDGI